MARLTARLVAFLAVCAVMPLHAQAGAADISAGAAALRAAGAPGDPAARLAHHAETLRTDPADYGALRGGTEAALAAGMMAKSDEDRRAYYERAVEYSKRMRLLRGDAVDSRYWQAVSRGMLADFEPVKDRIRIGQEVYEEATAILEDEPGHAGAHHILGRAHGAIMRMPGPARFFAGKILGGMMEDASWADAERHFEAARSAESGSLAHRYELGAVYRDTGRVEDALAAFAAVAEMRVRTPLDAPYVAKARDQVEALR